MLGGCISKGQDRNKDSKIIDGTNTSDRTVDKKRIYKLDYEINVRISLLSNKLILELGKRICRI